MYKILEKITKKPKPFQEYTAEHLWNDEHISAQMLHFHLDQNTDLASRNENKIDKIINFLSDRLKIDNNKAIIDFGCGPGLYASKMAKLGAKVCGIDFSKRSIEYAKKQSVLQGLEIDYIQGNYLEYDSSKTYDIATLIYCDLCPLSPEQRKILLRNIYNSLKKDGRLVFDVFSLAAFSKREETINLEKNLMHGFWSSKDYYGVMQTFIYEEQQIALDKYDIIEEDESKVVFNWLEYFSLDKIKTELSEVGFEIESYYSDLCGKEYDESSDEISIIAKKRS